MQAGMLIYGALVFGLLIAEMRGARMWQCLLKPLAALGFCLFAVYAGALGSLYGKLILAGLVACAAGDVCLLSRDKPALFKGGMAAFALGHFLYLTAFVTFADKTAINVWAILPIVIGLGFFWWVKPKLPKDMIIPVGMYSFIIILMVMRSLDMLWCSSHLICYSMLSIDLLWCCSDLILWYLICHWCSSHLMLLVMLHGYVMVMLSLDIL